MNKILDIMHSLLYIMYNKLNLMDYSMSALKNFRITNRIHVFRAEKRITQQELAEAVGVTRGTIVAMEKGNYNPSLELAFRLAKYFGADINAIFKAEEESNE